MFNGLDVLWAVLGFGAIAGLLLHYMGASRRALPSKPPNSVVLPKTYLRYMGQPGPYSLEAFREQQTALLSPQQLSTTEWLDEQAPPLVTRDWDAS